MAVFSIPFFSLCGRVRARPGLSLSVAILLLIVPSTGAAEEPTPIAPSYCRFGACLWEHHGEERTKLRGKKKVKKKELARIACGGAGSDEDGGIHHIDGRLLLDKNGQPTTCGLVDVIYTTSGTHTIGIADKDFTIDFEPVKWYAFDSSSYRWGPVNESAPTTDPLLGFLWQTSTQARVFGQGKANNVKMIILAWNLDDGWAWYHGLQPSEFATR